MGSERTPNDVKSFSHTIPLSKRAKVRREDNGTDVTRSDLRLNQFKPIMNSKKINSEARFIRVLKSILIEIKPEQSKSKKITYTHRTIYEMGHYNN